MNGEDLLVLAAIRIVRHAQEFTNTRLQGQLNDIPAEIRCAIEKPSRIESLCLLQAQLR